MYSISTFKIVSVSKEVNYFMQLFIISLIFLIAVYPYTVQYNDSLWVFKVNLSIHSETIRISISMALG